MATAEAGDLAEDRQPEKYSVSGANAPAEADADDASDSDSLEGQVETLVNYFPGEAFNLHPDQIEYRPADNQRWKEHTPDRIKEHAKSILTEGQIQPCGVVPLRIDHTETGPVVVWRLVWGFLRYLAVKHINDKELGSIDLKVIWWAGDQDKLLDTNTTENTARSDYSPMDAAGAIVRMQNEGRTTREICAKLSRPAGWVLKTARMLTLPADIQELIHTGKIPWALAAEWVTLEDPRDMDSAIRRHRRRLAEVQKTKDEEASNAVAGKPAKKGKGKRGRKTVMGSRAAAREMGKLRQRTATDIEDLLRKLACTEVSVASLDPHGFVESLRAFIAGHVDEDWMEDGWKRTGFVGVRAKDIPKRVKEPKPEPPRYVRLPAKPHKAKAKPKK